MHGWLCVYARWATVCMGDYMDVYGSVGDCVGGGWIVCVRWLCVYARWATVCMGDYMDVYGSVGDCVGGGWIVCVRVAVCVCVCWEGVTVSVWGWVTCRGGGGGRVCVRLCVSVWPCVFEVVVTVFVHAWVGDCVWKWVTLCVCVGGDCLCVCVGGWLCVGVTASVGGDCVFVCTDWHVCMFPPVHMYWHLCLYRSSVRQCVYSHFESNGSSNIAIDLCPLARPITVQLMTSQGALSGDEQWTCRTRSNRISLAWLGNEALNHRVRAADLQHCCSA